MQAGAEKLGVIEASYASAIIGVLSPVSSHCFFSHRQLAPFGFTDHWPLLNRRRNRRHGKQNPPQGGTRGSGGGKASDATGSGCREGSLIPLVPPVPPCGLQVPACVPPTAGRQLGSFSRWNPPWFVLSPSLPMINTQSIWLRFGAFLTPPTRFLRLHWPLFSRPAPHAGTSGDRSCADPPPLATA